MTTETELRSEYNTIAPCRRRFEAASFCATPWRSASRLEDVENIMVVMTEFFCRREMGRASADVSRRGRRGGTLVECGLDALNESCWSWPSRETPRRQGRLVSANRAV
jgi:hypothetical protein